MRIKSNFVNFFKPEDAIGPLVYHSLLISKLMIT